MALAYVSCLVRKQRLQARGYAAGALDPHVCSSTQVKAPSQCELPAGHQRSDRGPCVSQASTKVLPYALVFQLKDRVLLNLQLNNDM